MKTYLYIVSQGSHKKSISVYVMKNNKPHFVGRDDSINTEAYKGDYAVACKIISDHDGHLMNELGYKLKNKNIKVLELHIIGIA